MVAEYQHIVYREWLPIVLGNNFMRVYGLNPLSRVRFDWNVLIWDMIWSDIWHDWIVSDYLMIGFAIWRLAAHIFDIEGSLLRLQRHLRPQDQQWVCRGCIQVELLCRYIYILYFCLFLYSVSRFGHSLVPATLLSMVEGKSNRRPKQISLKEVFLAKAQHCPPSMILNHRL